MMSLFYLIINVIITIIIMTIFNQTGYHYFFTPDFLRIHYFISAYSLLIHENVYFLLD